jgi:hypothetical protein
MRSRVVYLEAAAGWREAAAVELPLRRTADAHAALLPAQCTPLLLSDNYLPRHSVGCCNHACMHTLYTQKERGYH